MAPEPPALPPADPAGRLSAPILIITSTAAAPKGSPQEHPIDHPLRRPLQARWAGLALLGTLLCAAAAAHPAAEGQASPARRGADGPPAAGAASRPPAELVVVHRPRRTAAPGVVIRIVALEAIPVDGAAVPITTGALEMRGDAAAGAELARGAIPAGRYRGLRVATSPEPPGAEPAPVKLEAPFEAEAGRVTTLFLTWDPSSVAGGVPAEMSAQVERPELRSLLLFVTNRGSGDLTVIQRDRDEVVGVVRIGSEPMGIEAGPADGRVYVANAGSDSVSVIDALSRRVIDTVPLDFGSRPVDLAVSPDGLRLYVAASERSTVKCLDAASLHELAEADVGLRPDRLAVSADGRHLYVTNQGSNSVTVLDAGSLRVEATVPVEARPADLAVDPGRDRLFVAHLGSDGIAVVGPARTVERILHFGGAVSGIGLDEAGRRLYLSVPLLDRLLIAQPDAESVTGTIRLRSPGRFALDPDGRKMYVLEPEDDRLRVVNRILARPEGSIPTGSRPFDLVVLP